MTAEGRLFIIDSLESKLKDKHTLPSHIDKEKNVYKFTDKEKNIDEAKLQGW